ncbi:unnamed protein product [Lactuca saligna]|uniref:Uncharacterized protein n=1 Tax=Lactuca saligna TaxID=75948 RepID=A0AA35VVW0_LACSI|nr:unnamed protein product [Lactuca saligna]
MKQWGEKVKWEEPQPMKTTGEQHDAKPKPNENMGIEDFASCKCKERIYDYKNEEELSEGEKLVRKKCDKELDNLLHLRKELEDKEKKVEVENATLETHKLLFPPWTMDQI